jgi:hypothetical protein
MAAVGAGLCWSGLSWLQPEGPAAHRAGNLLRRITFRSLNQMLAMRTGEVHGTNSCAEPGRSAGVAFNPRFVSSAGPTIMLGNLAWRSKGRGGSRGRWRRRPAARGRAVRDPPPAVPFVSRPSPASIPTSATCPIPAATPATRSTGRSTSRQPQQVASELLDPPRAEAVGARQGRDHGLGARAEVAGRDPLGPARAGDRSTARAIQAMQAVFVDDRLDPWQLGDLMDQGGGIGAPRRMAAPPTGIGPIVGGRAELLGRDQARNALRWPGCPPRFLGDAGDGGFRFRPIGSEAGGLDELVELNWSRAWRSRTVASGAAIRYRRGVLR